VIELTEKIALAAALLSIEHKLPMADSIILATARAFDATLWTQDEHFQGMAGVEYIAKPSGAAG
jgi:predicted nucleic acid-binding protein